MILLTMQKPKNEQVLVCAKENGTWYLSSPMTAAKANSICKDLDEHGIPFRLVTRPTVTIEDIME